MFLLYKNPKRINRGCCFEGLDAGFRNLPIANEVVTETGQQLPPSIVKQVTLFWDQELNAM